MFYSKSTGGFYDESIHGTRKLSIVSPDFVHPLIDVVLQPDERVESVGRFFENKRDVPITVKDVPDPSVTPPLVDVDNPDCKIPGDAVEISEAAHRLLLTGQSEGKKIVADAEGRPVLADPPPPTEEELAINVRADRDRLLAASDWTQARDVPEALSAKWAPYRQSLRDVPAQSGFPSAITWPEQPK